MADVDVGGTPWMSRPCRLIVPLVRRVEAGYQIEQGGLAGAVRADQRMDLAGVDRSDARVRHRADAAELLATRSRPPARCRRDASRPQKLRQRQAFVDLALAHRGRFFRRRRGRRISRAARCRRGRSARTARSRRTPGRTRATSSAVQIENSSRNRMKNIAPSAGPRMRAHAADHDHRQSSPEKGPTRTRRRPDNSGMPSQRAGEARSRPPRSRTRRACSVRPDSPESVARSWFSRIASSTWPNGERAEAQQRG